MVGQRQAFKRTAGFGEHHSQDLPARFLPIFLLLKGRKRVVTAGLFILVKVFPGVH